MIKKSLEKLLEYIIKEKYRGYDPYDILMSPVFKFPLLKFRKVRFYLQQLDRRIPLNTRKILQVPKGYNPVTLGLILQSYVYLSKTFPERRSYFLSEIEFLKNELTKIKSNGFSGICWGYDFDWESRYDSIPAFTPTVVATGIITNALYKNYVLNGDKKSLDMCRSSVDFIRYDLNKIYEGNTFCYSYSPNDNQVVFNATMKGARLLSQIYCVYKDMELYDEAKRTVAFVMKHQNINGAWIYSHNDKRDWVDNYHTGYILNCLNDYCKLTGDMEYHRNLEMGIEHYFNNFFIDNKIPKFYDKSIYPIDCTAASQSIITLLEFGFIRQALQVAEWMIINMQAHDGHFFYRKYKHYTIKTSYMRWSNAWMLLALSYLLYRLNFKS